MKQIWITAAIGMGLALAQNAPRVELVGFAVLPADTFASGPASGAFRETPGFRAATAPFNGQPVQGFSAIQFGPSGSYWVMPDNGFGSKANSADYYLRVYQINLQPRTA